MDELDRFHRAFTGFTVQNDMQYLEDEGYVKFIYFNPDNDPCTYRYMVSRQIVLDNDILSEGTFIYVDDINLLEITINEDACDDLKQAVKQSNE